MFNKPSRNHISIIAEQFGAVGLVLLTGAVSLLFDFAGESMSSVNISLMLKRITSGDIYLAMLAAAVAAGIVFAVWSFIRSPRKTTAAILRTLPALPCWTLNASTSLKKRICL